MLARGTLIAAGLVTSLCGVAWAQDNATLGPPQLKDFRLTPGEGSPPQPAPQPPPEPQAQPQPQPQAPAPPQAEPQSGARSPAPAPTPAPSEREAATPGRQPVPAERGSAEAGRDTAGGAAAGPELVPPLPDPSALQAEGLLPIPPAAPVRSLATPPVSGRAASSQPAPTGSLLWFLLIPLLLAALGGYYLLSRRRRDVPPRENDSVSDIVGARLPAPETPASAKEAGSTSPLQLREVASAPSIRPRHDPVPAPPPPDVPQTRAWLEIELRAERAAATLEEATVDFELVIRNTGATTAEDVSVNARMFNAGADQDREIGTFFETRGAERRTFSLPPVPPGGSGVIRGTVAMARSEMQAVRFEERLLFIPVVGVNAVYRWAAPSGQEQGQTSRSYVIGRELGEAQEKMGPFRLDLGPRVYRTVGQRPHKVDRKV